MNNFTNPNLKIKIFEDLTTSANSSWEQGVWVSGDTEMELALSSSPVLGIKHKQHRTISPISYHSSHKYSPTTANGTSSTLFLSLNTTMLSNGYVGRGSSSSSIKIPNNSSNSRIYRRQDSCLVIAPPNGKTPRAIIKFLGGAFIGAVPEVTYR